MSQALFDSIGSFMTTFFFMRAGMVLGKNDGRMNMKTILFSFLGMAGLFMIAWGAR